MLRTRDSRLRRGGVIVGVAAIALVFALLDAIVTSVADPWNRPTSSFGFAFSRLVIPWALLGLLCAGAIVLASLFPIRRPHAARNVSAHAAAALSFPFVHLLGVALYHRLILDESIDVWQSFREMLSTYIAQDIFAYVVVVALVHAARYWNDARAAERRATEMQGVLAQAQLVALRAQLHPHFLFNTLNTAVMLVRDGEKRKAVDVLTNLSDLLRRVLEGESSEISLEDEIELVGKYVSIEQERFHDRFEVHISIDPEAHGALVPGFILQPLVENAIRHGVANRAAGGAVALRAHRANETLILEVADNGHGPEPAEALPGHGIGLRNTSERLQRLYGVRGRCTIERGNPGAIVRLELPFRVALAEAR